MFVSYCERFIEKIVLISAKIQYKFIDFYTNIRYTMISTFKEDCLCIERLWASWKRGKKVNTVSPLFCRVQDRLERPIPFWSLDAPITKMWHTLTLKRIQSWTKPLRKTSAPIIWYRFCPISQGRPSWRKKRWLYSTRCSSAKELWLRSNIFARMLRIITSSRQAACSALRRAERNSLFL